MLQDIGKMKKQTTKIKNVIIVAGGTGGHIVPGIALAQEFVKNNINIIFLTLYKNKDYPDFKLLKQIPFFFYNAPEFPKISKPISIIKFPFKLFFSIIRVFIIIKKNNITDIVGMGGGPTFPALLVASLTTKNIYLCEQNAVAGKVSRIFYKKAKKIFINFPVVNFNKNFNLTNKIFQVGNPIRQSIINESHKITGKKLIKKNSFNILVLGGSQGAKQINEIISKIIFSFKDKINTKLMWNWQCGKLNYEELNKTFNSKNFPNINLLAYEPNIEKLFINTDIMICRSGAGGVSEALCFGIPLLLIPYPFAADNHQELNANYLVKNNAAYVFPQKDTDESKLEKTLINLIEDNEKRIKMGEATLKLSKPNAAENIVKEILF